MTPTYLRVLCSALGLTAVVVQGGKLPREEGTKRAIQFASLIEDFCRETVPEAFEDSGLLRVVDVVSTDSQSVYAVAERMATAIADLYREQGGCLPQDLLAKGFRNDEIIRHWAMANALAKIELNIMDS